MLAMWASSEVLYEDIRSCGTPLLCQDCLKEAAKAVQEFPLLKVEVQLLRAENIGLKEELTEVRALLTSMHSALTNLEARVTSVADTINLLQATPSPAVSQTERGGSVGGGVRNYASACSGNGGVACRTQRHQGPEDKLCNRNNGTGQKSWESIHTEAGKVQEEVGALTTSKRRTQFIHCNII